MAKRKDQKTELQRFVIRFIVSLFAVHSLSAIVLLYLQGLGHSNLPSDTLMSLLYSTFGEAAAIFVLVCKYLFARETLCVCQRSRGVVASQTDSERTLLKARRCSDSIQSATVSTHRSRF